MSNLENPAEPGRSTTHDFRVRWGETDAFGIVFYPTFYAWMDQATHEFFRTPARAFRDLIEEDGFAFPIVEARCRFRRPARYDDVLAVRSSVTDLRSRSFRIEHTFEREGELLASGHEVRAFARVDPDDPTRLLTEPMPDDLRSFLSGEIG